MVCLQLKCNRLRYDTGLASGLRRQRNGRSVGQSAKAPNQPVTCMYRVTKGANMFDLTLVNLAQQAYEERLAQAEMQRRFRRVAQSEPGLVDHLLANLGRLLVDTGERLQHRAEMRPGLS